MDRLGIFKYTCQLYSTQKLVLISEYVFRISKQIQLATLHCLMFSHLHLTSKVGGARLKPLGVMQH